MLNCFNKVNKIDKAEQYEFPILEVLIGRNVESLITRKPIISKKHKKILNKFINKHNIDEDSDIYLYDFRNNYYPIKSVEGRNLILHPDKITLKEDISYLTSLNIVNFAIDLRWKFKNYNFEDI